jgi:cytochrome c oxidase subunit 2
MKIKLIFPVVAAALIGASFLFSPSIPAEEAPVRLEVTAKRFEFTPAEVTVKKGQPAVLILKDLDVPHGVRFKELGIDIKAGKGQNSEAPFTPTKTGTFVGHCSVFCGAGHGKMTLTIHVVD